MLQIFISINPHSLKKMNDKKKMIRPISQPPTKALNLKIINSVDDDERGGWNLLHH